MPHTDHDDPGDSSDLILGISSKSWEMFDAVSKKYLEEQSQTAVAKAIRELLPLFKALLEKRGTCDSMLLKCPSSKSKVWKSRKEA